MKKAVYTCITGNYDILPQPAAVRADWDYICFTDDPSAGSDGVWQLRPFKYEGDRRLISRYPKILPHLALADYDASLYLDANIRILGDGIYEAAEECLADGALWAGIPHPDRDCVYEEIRRCYLSGHARWRDALKLKKQLQNAGFPQHSGLLENNAILRRHNDLRVIAVDEDWWEAYSKGIKRDQLHLMPALLKEGLKPVDLLPDGRNARNSEALGLVPHAQPFCSAHPRPRLVKAVLKRFL